MIKNLFKKNFVANKENEKYKEKDNNIINVLALLIEASAIDGEISKNENQRIKEMTSKYFKIDNKIINIYYEEALNRQIDNTAFHNFTTIINSRFNYNEKIEILEMLWNVVLIDKIEHDFESSLMRRICGLLHVKDIDNGNIRKKVLNQLNIERT